MEPIYYNIVALYNDIKNLTVEEFLKHLNILLPEGTPLDDLPDTLHDYIDDYADDYTPEDLAFVETQTKIIFTEVTDEATNKDYSEVYYLEHYDVYIKRTADYYSYFGFDNFTEFKIVQRINKMITVYE